MTSLFQKLILATSLCWTASAQLPIVPFTVSSSSVGLPAGNVLLYDSLNGVATKTGTLINGDFVMGWTNTAPGGSHTYDLLTYINTKTWGNGRTNPIYRASGFGGTNGTVPTIDFSQTTNGFSFATIATSNSMVPLGVSQPYVTFLAFYATSVSSGSPPFNHAIWSSTGDNDIGDQGLADVGSPPWIMKNVNDCSGTVLQTPAFSGGVWYVVTTVWNGANSLVRTNGVAMVSGSGNPAAFGCGGFGFDFGQSTGNTPYYISRFALWNRLLSTNEMVTVENQWRSDLKF